ncbi:MAG: phage baseplate assembly protein V, partial [Sandaracinaceae bacterium]|nr:phage baseplate assembly protein V [Sandaracinaceae bacterium]
MRRVTFRSDVIGATSSATLKLRGFPFERNGRRLPASADPPPADLLVVERARWTGGDPNVPTGVFVSSPQFTFTAPVTDSYSNELSAYWYDKDDPARTPVRPERRTPKPRIVSLQTATVVDWQGDEDEDEEVEVDHLTLRRVRVRFHWDRRGEIPLDIEQLAKVGWGRTCWCRAAQAWAGDDFGVLFVPRIGSEVVLAFENGDPDRPYVIGSLYDGLHPVPTAAQETARDGFEPPKADPKALSTLMTRTTPWDDEEGVTSELSFDDTVQHERVVLKAGRHLVEEVRKTHTTSVGNDQSNEVGRHHGEIIEKQQILTVGGWRHETVHTDRLVTVEGHHREHVERTQTVEVASDHVERVQGSVDLKVKGERKLVVHGSRFAGVGEQGKEPAHDVH